MSTSTRPVSSCPAPLRRGAVPAVALLLVAGGLASVAPGEAAADSAVAPRSGSFTVSGAGFGHGIGMSQYGAYGAAVRGLGYRSILSFYYPGTRVAAAPRSTMRVWVTADSDSSTAVSAATGLKITTAAGRSLTLPTGTAYRSWRVRRSGSGYQLSYRGSSGSWKTRATSLDPSTWTFASSADQLTLQLPSGTRTLRGKLSLIKWGNGGRTVNTVSLEDYVRGVVPAEMPTSWHPQAVRVQAVAARTYAARLQAGATSSGYDICDTTACQVYRGRAAETVNGNAATDATRGQILWYGSTIALAMFSSANGGQSISGGLPYLRAAPDPYDGVIKSQSWTKSVSAASIGRRWSVGTVKSIKITQRTGGGRWGGYVTSLQIAGSSRTTTISGNTFKYAFGLRSTYFTLGGAITADPVTGPVVSPVVNRPGPAYASFPRSYRSGSTVDLLVVAGGNLVRYPVSGAQVGAPAVIASGFGSYTHVANAGDWNGDGFQDVIARTTGGRLLLFRGTSTGRLAGGVDMGLVSNHRSVTAVGDVTGDRHPDLVVVATSGRAYLVRGNGRTGFASWSSIGSGWGSRSVRGVGDLSGDGKPDLISQVDDRLYLHRSATSGFAAPVAVGPALGSVIATTAVGDVNRDGRVDVIGRTASGSLQLFRGQSGGRLADPVALNGSYRGIRFAS